MVLTPIVSPCEIERRQPGDNIADANVLANRSIKLSSKSEIRGVLQFTARSDFRQYNIAGGLETPSLTLLPFINSGRKGGLGLVNWFFLGVSGENQKRPANEGGDQDVALTSYRAFLGRGFGFVESDASKKVRSGQSAFIAKIRQNTEGTDGNVDIGKLRDTLKRADATVGTKASQTEDELVYSTVKLFISAVEQDQTPMGKLLAAENRTTLDKYITDMASMPPKPPINSLAPNDLFSFRSNWEKYVFGGLRGYFLPVKDRARYELYAEFRGMVLSEWALQDRPFPEYLFGKLQDKLPA